MDQSERMNRNGDHTMAARGAAALAVGLGLGICSAQHAEAVIIHSSTLDTLPLPFMISDDFANIDVDDDGYDDLILYHYFFDFYADPNYHGFGVYAGISTNPFALTGVIGELGPYYEQYAKNLPAGYLVGPGGSFYPNDDYPFNYVYLFEDFFFNYYGTIYEGTYGNFAGQDGYFGFKFQTPDYGDVYGDYLPSDEPTVMYGWARILVDPELESITLVEWAYQDDGSPISVGDTGSEVPIPSSLLLLATGAAGLIGMRRKKG